MADRKKALIQKAAIARRQLGMDDGTYRMMLNERYGVDSSTKMTIPELSDLLNFYVSKGWQPTKAKTRKPTAAQEKGRGYQGEYVKIDPRDPLAKQKRYALALAKILGWKLAGLHTRCSRQFGIDRLEWIAEQDQMQTLISDMQSRCKKRGLDYLPQA